MALFRPSLRVHDVLSIDRDALIASGIRGLLIDLDNTLLPRDTSIVPEKLSAWIQDSSQSFGICLVSNNWHERVHEVAAEMGLPLVAKAIKPLPFAFLRAMHLIDVRPRECAVIGDQLFTDVIGGNLLGAMTIMVDPLSQTDLPHTLLLRRLEARIMKGQPTQATTTTAEEETCE